MRSIAQEQSWESSPTDHLAPSCYRRAGVSRQVQRSVPRRQPRELLMMMGPMSHASWLKSVDRLSMTDRTPFNPPEMADEITKYSFPEASLAPKGHSLANLIFGLGALDAYRPLCVLGWSLMSSSLLAPHAAAMSCLRALNCKSLLIFGGDVFTMLRDWRQRLF
jgi:hypothetical protein